jgi:hypothetical protein
MGLKTFFGVSSTDGIASERMTLSSSKTSVGGAFVKSCKKGDDGVVVSHMRDFGGGPPHARALATEVESDLGAGLEMHFCALSEGSTESSSK